MSKRNLGEKIKLASYDDMFGGKDEIVWIGDEDIIDNPKNEEDCTYLDDILASIESQGFTEQLIVTDFGMSKGKYMLISGHRRRTAGRVKGYKEFPCIIRHYDTEVDAYEALLTANISRNIERDPLLFAVRYRQYEELLEMKNFKGSRREEIAKRLGISVKQADKYKTFNRIIKDVWDLVRNGVPMEPLCTLATEDEEVQRDICKLLVSASENEKLNSAMVKNIIEQYRYSQQIKGQLKLEDAFTNSDQNGILKKSPRDEELLDKNKKESTNLVVNKTVLGEMSGQIKKKIEGHNDLEKAKNRELVEKNERIYKLEDERPDEDCMSPKTPRDEEILKKGEDDISDEDIEVNNLNAEIQTNFRIQTSNNIYEVIYGEFDMSYFCWIRDVRGNCYGFNLMAPNNRSMNEKCLMAGGINDEDAIKIAGYISSL